MLAATDANVELYAWTFVPIINPAAVLNSFALKLLSPLAVTCGNCPFTTSSLNLVALPSSIPNVKASCFPFHVPADDIYESAIAVPCHIPVPIVPSVVIDAWPT